MGRPKAGQEKRKDLVDAALALFRERGIKGTTIREIAARAGVTCGALYRHFPGKRGLAQALFDECAGRLTQTLREAAEGKSDPRQALAAVPRALLGFSRREPAAFGYILERHEEEVQRAQPGRELPKDILERVIAAGVGSGCFPEQDVSLGAALVIGMCIRAVFFFEREMLASSWEETVARVVRAALLVIEQPGEGPGARGVEHDGDGSAQDCEH